MFQTQPAEPGPVHDITAARAQALPALYRAAAAGLGVGEVVPGRQGAGVVRAQLDRYGADLQIQRAVQAKRRRGDLC